MFLIFIPVHIAVMVVLMRLFAKKEADLDLPKCVLFFGCTTGALSFVSPADLWALPAYFLLPFAVLGLFFYVPWPKAAAISACFLVYLFVFSLVIRALST